MIPDTPQTLLKKIAEYANGDDAAEWVRFVELYTPVIRAFVTSNAEIGAADVDDVIQDIFIRLVSVLRSGRYCPDKGRFRAYLGTMVRRILIDRHRRTIARGAGKMVSIDDIELLDETPDAAAWVDCRLLHARHAAAVEHVLTHMVLDARTVAAYRAYVLDGEPPEAVSSRLGMTVNALRQVKHRVGRVIAAVEASYGD